MAKIYKRATAQLKKAGVNDIAIVRYLWGPSPMYVGVSKQQSKCFATWQDAVKAVVDGYRPTIIEQGEKS